jgi:integrase
MKLTEKSVSKLSVGEKRAHQYDDEVTGFGVRVEPNGRKSFFWCAKVDGEVCFKSLGEFPSVPVSEARTAAKKWAGTAASWKQSGYEGENPLRKKKRIKSTTPPSFGALVEAYIERHIRKETLHPVRAEYDVRLLVKNYLSDWSEITIDKITVDDVLAAKNSCEGHYMQNSIVELVRRVYNWSAGKGADGKLNFWKIPENPAKDVALNKREKRRRFLQPEELVRFHAELAKELHADTRDVLTLLLATGARKANVYEMAWADISFELETWTVQMSKNGEGYVVELTPAALTVLKRRYEKKESNAVFVFPANSMSGHIQDIKRRWSEFRKRAAIPDVRLHDLRRSKASWAAISGESLQKIAALLGHKSQSSTEIYSRLNQQSIRQTSLASDLMMKSMMAQAKRRLKAAARKSPSRQLPAAVTRG